MPARSRVLRYGDIVDSASGSVLDEVLVSYMAGPKTYTREDVVEINCHGGPVVLTQVLELVLKHGARAAFPGEFTKRAFLAGRLDLAQAEAVLDIIQAKTERGLKLAREQLRGGLSRRVVEVRERLLDLLAPIEAYLDFPDEDVREPPREIVRQGLEETLASLSELIRAYAHGEIFRTGVKMVLVGKANVGKSSLFNRLLDRPRAIVTSVPGTTTDVIEEAVNLSGILVRLVDMAGLGGARNEIEAEGVKKAQEELSHARLVLCVMDQSIPIDDQDVGILRDVQRLGTSVLLVLNKSDLPTAATMEDIIQATGIDNPLWVSALTGEGIGELESAIVKAVVRDGVKGGPEELAPVNMRHKEVLERTAGAVADACRTITGGTTWDLTALELQRSLHILGEIVGETTPDDVLERIFSRFCIGK